MNARRAAAWSLLAAALLLYWAGGRASAAGPAAAVDAAGEPLQEPTGRAPFALAASRGRVAARPRFAYDVSARVLAAERYRFDDLAFLSPLDLALAWGELADPALARRLEVSQSWRFYFWRAPADFGLAPARVVAQSANTHIVPATANLRRALLAVDAGDVVRLRGLLVDLAGERFRWSTSTVRGDHGDTGCEILWVEELERDGRSYR
jgi:hypothetical protein